MKLDINPRGNGACPLCERLPDCRIRERLIASVAEISDRNGSGIEIAIYNCSFFTEKDRP